jgi:hypothetical protein
MADNGRLIINERGECVQVFPSIHHPHYSKAAIIVQIAVKADRITHIPGHIMQTSELSLSSHETKALILKLADALGLACELQDKKKEPNKMFSQILHGKIVPAKPGKE